ncbi:MAG: hypothetical protein JWQ25_2574, partial [Daejeonella sp.]|nr:hypothetical protein [Daejeonella sp.]
MLKIYNRVGDNQTNYLPMKSSQIFNFKYQFLGLCVLAFVLTFNSCKKDEKANEIAESSNSTAVLNYIKSLGYTDLQIKNMGDEYLVDGDISFPKDMVIPKNISNPKDIKTKQWGTGSYVTSTDIVYVTIDPSMSAYTSQITAAFAQWNSVCSSRIHFAIYNSQIPT